MEKLKSRPEWYPPSISHVNDADIQETFFSKYSPSRGTAPTLQPPAMFDQKKLPNPMRFALPTEEEIGQMVSGDHPSSGGTVITEEELLTKFVDLKRGKNGVREKVLEVVQRKCSFDQDKHLNKTWLKWRS